MSPLEKKFHTKVTTSLGNIKGLYFFTKEALAIRGIPDIVGCYKGRFFAWELKRNLPSTLRKTGRIVLQKYTIGLIRRAGGIGEFVCPENFQDNLHKLLDIPQ